METQVAVVGAGPAGAAAAIHLKRRHLRVALIDKAAFPRDKVCGDGIPLKTFHLLQELGFDEQVLFSNGYKINHLHVYAPDHRKVSYGKLKPDASTKSGCIPRLYFDDVLFQKAKSMADAVLLRHKVLDIGLEKGRRIIRIKNLQNGQIKKIVCDLVIAADGSKSLIAHKIGLLNNSSTHFFDGLRLYYEGGRFEPAIHLFYDKRTLPGYVWIFPVSKTKANVGIMIDKRTAKRNKKNIREIFLEVLETNPAVKNVLKNSRPFDKIKGAPLALGTLPGRRIAEGLILIGDAAAFINPITGGGIYYGILSAKQAVEVGSRAIEKQDMSLNALMPYEKWWRKEILPGFVYSQWLKKRFASERFSAWFLSLAARFRPFANFFIFVYGRPLPKGVFWNPLFWLKVFFYR